MVTSLYELHAVGLIRLAVIMLGDQTAAEDVVQEAFCGLYRRWSHLSDPGKALPYVRSAVLNGCRTQLRARIRAERRAAATAVSAVASAEDELLVAEEHREVLTALRNLPARQREALVLRFYLDLAEPDIAAAMGISAGTVKSTTSRAIAALGVMLRGERCSSTEDRLRAAARAAADTVADGSAPPLRLPERKGLGRARGRFLIVVTPVAAAIAVAAIVVAAAIVHTSLRPPDRPPSAPTAAPRYFVALAYLGQFKPGKVSRADAVIASTSTGRTLATVPVPAPYNSFVAISAAPDDRTFVLAAQTITKHFLAKRKGIQLYSLLIRTRPGKPVTYFLTKLQIPPLPAVTPGRNPKLALSPDGTKLAVINTNAPAITVYTLPTGTHHTWHIPQHDLVAVPATDTPSWQADNRHLALDTSSQQPGTPKCLDCIRLLDTAARRGTLLADSKLIVRSPSPHAVTDWNSALITPDGSHILRTAIVPIPITRHSFFEQPRIYDYAASGKLLRTIAGPRGTTWTLLWTSPDGQSYITASANDGDNPFITATLTTSGHRTSIRLPARTLTAAW